MRQVYQIYDMYHIYETYICLCMLNGFETH